MQEYRVTVGEHTPGTIRFFKPYTTVLHRLDGPAVECADGRVEYWIEGKKYSMEEFLAKTAPAKEMTMADLEKVLGYKVKIIK